MQERTRILESIVNTGENILLSYSIIQIGESPYTIRVSCIKERSYTAIDCSTYWRDTI